MTGEVSDHAVVLLRRGPQWDAAKPLIEQPGVRDHLAYLGRLHEECLLVQGGPFHQPSEVVPGELVGLLVYAVDRDEALRCALEDPAVRAGLLECEALSWYP